MAISPTPKQLLVLLFIAGFCLHHRRAPTCAEIAIGCGLNHKGHAHEYLNALEERGQVMRPFKHARDLFVLNPPAVPRAPDGAPLYFVAIG